MYIFIYYILRIELREKMLFMCLDTKTTRTKKKQLSESLILPIYFGYFLFELGYFLSLEYTSDFSILFPQLISSSKMADTLFLNIHCYLIFPGIWLLWHRAVSWNNFAVPAYWIKHNCFTEHCSTPLESQLPSRCPSDFQREKKNH